MDMAAGTHLVYEFFDHVGPPLHLDVDALGGFPANEVRVRHPRGEDEDARDGRRGQFFDAGQPVEVVAGDEDQRGVGEHGGEGEGAEDGVPRPDVLAARGRGPAAFH